jgi:hypothetical protein
MQLVLRPEIRLRINTYNKQEMRSLGGHLSKWLNKPKRLSAGESTQEQGGVVVVVCACVCVCVQSGGDGNTRDQTAEVPFRDRALNWYR